VRRALPLAILLAALIAIAAGIGLLPRVVLFVAKPLATALLICYACGRGHDTPGQRRAILVGLVLSLAGDVALLWPERGFVPGLVAFLLAHLAYIVAFCRRARLFARWGPVVGYAAVAGAILALLWPGVPAGLRVPVLAYVLCLAAMAAQAAIAWLATHGPQGGDLAARAAARSGAIGGALFVASDALLAINKFATPLPLASLWVLATYWAAQWCIANALRERTPLTSP